MEKQKQLNSEIIESVRKAATNEQTQDIIK